MLGLLFCGILPITLVLLLPSSHRPGLQIIVLNGVLFHADNGLPGVM